MLFTFVKLFVHKQFSIIRWLVESYYAHYTRIINELVCYYIVELKEADTTADLRFYIYLSGR